MIILNAVFIWNDFLTPLIVVYQYVSTWGYVFAAVVLVALLRFVIKGFSSGLKG